MPTEAKFSEGSTVYALAFPKIKLIVRRYVDRVYYCRVDLEPSKEMVYFERELTDLAPSSA